jgi:hypothetical protein
MGVMANPASIERILFAVFTHANHTEGCVDFTWFGPVQP